VALDGPRAERDVHGRRGPGGVLPAYDGAVAEVVTTQIDTQHLVVQYPPNSKLKEEVMTDGAKAGEELRNFLSGERFATVMADPPWRFQNRTGKIAPEHKRLARYPTLELAEISALPVCEHVLDRAHCYLWVPNALLPEGLCVLNSWGFSYKSHIVWEKVRKDGGPDGRGVGFYFRNVTEILLFGVRGKGIRTLEPGRRQVNFIEASEGSEPNGDLLKTRKREHSRKPDEQYEIIESCSAGPYLELFGRGQRQGWTVWGNQADADYKPTWRTYAHNSSVEAAE
jgi:N6-adenosine-specific RNA methylase IME4